MLDTRFSESDPISDIVLLRFKPGHGEADEG